MLRWLGAIALLAVWGCASERSSNAVGGAAGDAPDGSAGTPGAGAPGAGGSGGHGGFGGSSDASNGDAEVDAATPDECQVLLEIPGVAHVSTPAELKKVITIAQPGPTSWRSIRVELDAYHAGWSPKQGQYEVFTLLRSNKWVGNAIGYIAFVGPASRKTVMVANLNLPFAAAPDGRRITKNYAYEPNVGYHLDYVYDVKADLRELIVSVGGAEVTRVTGKVSVPTADPVVTSVEVPKSGFTFLMGGEQTEGPDCATLDWKFENVRITGCPTTP